jgi:predicted membrane channel-forming protein YqfA (hemolysin III family)
VQIGIVILIVGSILPGMYYGFNDNRPCMYFYMGEYSYTVSMMPLRTAFGISAYISWYCRSGSRLRIRE